jgi:hypothetical protein
MPNVDGKKSNKKGKAWLRAWLKKPVRCYKKMGKKNNMTE